MNDSWFRCSREQTEQINRLAQQWQTIADPVVIFEAALLVMLNVLDRDVPATEQEPAVENVYCSLLGVLSEQVERN